MSDFSLKKEYVIYDELHDEYFHLNNLEDMKLLCDTLNSLRRENKRLESSLEENGLMG